MTNSAKYLQFTIYVQYGLSTNITISYLTNNIIIRLMNLHSNRRLLTSNPDIMLSIVSISVSSDRKFITILTNNPIDLSTDLGGMKASISLLSGYLID